MQKQNQNTSEKKVQHNFKKLVHIQKECFSELLSFQYDKEDDESYISSCRPRVRSKRISKAQRREREGLYLRAKFRFITSAESVKDIQQFSQKLNLSWEKVTQVLFHSIEGEVTCPICMSPESQIMAPQITPCGHIFCWHCYLKHEDLSDTKYYCPLCNEYAPSIDLKSVKLILRPRNAEYMTFQLLAREQDSDFLYNAESMQEDDRFSKILIAQNSYILEEILLKERSDLEIQIQESLSAGEEWDIPFLSKALDINLKKIQKIQESENSTSTDSLDSAFKKKKSSQDCQPFLLKSLSNPKQEKLNYFYQEESGALTFLNPINFKYLLLEKKDSLPFSISAKLVEEQNACVDNHFLKRQPYLKHLTPFSDVQFAEVDMNQLLNLEALNKNNKELANIHQKLKEKDEREAKKMQKNRKPSAEQGIFDREYCLMNDLIILPPPDSFEIEEQNYPQLKDIQQEELSSSQQFSEWEIFDRDNEKVSLINNKENNKNHSIGMLDYQKETNYSIYDKQDSNGSKYANQTNQWDQENIFFSPFEIIEKQTKFSKNKKSKNIALNGNFFH